MNKTLRDLWKDQSGATAVEYGLIAGLISIAAIFALTQTGGSLQTIFGAVGGELGDAAVSAAGSAP